MKKKYCPDLANDGAACDANYIRLRQLMPDMANKDKIEFGILSKYDEPTRICFEVIERCKYTIILAMHLSFMNSKDTRQWLTPHTMQIRIYHDLKTAEVIGSDQVKHFQSRYEYPNSDMNHSDEKSQMNNFLGELLADCLANGHAVDWQFEHDYGLQINRREISD